MSNQELEKLKQEIETLRLKGYQQSLPTSRPKETGEKCRGNIVVLFLRKNKSTKTFALRAQVKTDNGFARCSLPEIHPIGTKIELTGDSFVPSGETEPVMFWRFAGTVAGSQEQQSQTSEASSVQCKTNWTEQVKAL